MKKTIFILLLFFIATGYVYSRDCGNDFCKKSNVKGMFSKSNRSFSFRKKLEKQIIASVNNQVSKINTDLSLSYRKKTISVRYNMSDQIPKVNSYVSISYGKSAVSLNYTMALW